MENIKLSPDQNQSDSVGPVNIEGKKRELSEIEGRLREAERVFEGEIENIQKERNEKIAELHSQADEIFRRIAAINQKADTELAQIRKQMWNIDLRTEYAQRIRELKELEK